MDNVILTQSESVAPLVIPYMPAGEHIIHATVNGEPDSRLVVVDEPACARLNADLADLLKLAAEGKRARPVVYFDHKQGEAAAFPLRFLWAPDRGVMLELESWSAAGRAAVEGHNYNYVSPAFRLSREDGQVLGLTGGVEVASLVNDPAFEEIPPIDSVAASHAEPRKPGVDVIGASHCNQHRHASDCDHGAGDGKADDREPWEKRRDEREHLEELLAELERQEEASRDAESAGDSRFYSEEKARERWDELVREGDPQSREAIEKRLEELDRLDREDDTQGAKNNVKSTKRGLDIKASLPHNTTNPTQNNMDNDTKKKLGLPEDADDDAVKAAIADLLKERDEHKKKAEEAEAACKKKDEELKAARAAEKQAWLDDLKKRGVIAPQDEEAITAASTLFDANSAAARLAYSKMPAADDSEIIKGGKADKSEGIPGNSLVDMLMAEK